MVPFEYSYSYPTPIGIILKMKLYASWDALLFFDVKLQNAILDMGAGAATKVVVGGEVSASAIVAEVGGYAEGTFLQAELRFGINLQVLNNVNFLLLINF